MPNARIQRLMQQVHYMEMLDTIFSHSGKIVFTSRKLSFFGE